MSEDVRRYGTLNDHELRLVRIPIQAQPGRPLSSLALYLTNGADQRFVGSYADTPDGNHAAAGAATAILSAATILGIKVELGG